MILPDADHTLSACQPLLCGRQAGCTGYRVLRGYAAPLVVEAPGVYGGNGIYGRAADLEGIGDAESFYLDDVGAAGRYLAQVKPMNVLSRGHRFFSNERIVPTVFGNTFVDDCTGFRGVAFVDVQAPFASASAFISSISVYISIAFISASAFGAPPGACREH